MTGRSFRRFMLIAAAFALIVAACGRDEESSGGGDEGPAGTTSSGEEIESVVNTEDCDPAYDPSKGVSDTSVSYGTSLPLSGPFSLAFSPIPKGYTAYFDTLNADEGGIEGRDVSVTTTDDAYEPGTAAQNFNQLVQDDGVFGLFNGVGTSNTEAILEEQNIQCVPNLFVATGSAQFGNPKEYPWTIGGFPAYSVEAAIFGDYLVQNDPDAKVAVLLQNDAFGEEYLAGFEAAVEGSDIEVVETATYEFDALVDTSSQINALQGSGADTLLLAATGTACANALNAAQDLGWEPLTYVSGTCGSSSTGVGLAEAGAADGVLTTLWLKDPLDPQWDDDPGMQQFREAGAAQGLTPEDLQNGVVIYGWTIGQLLAEVMSQAPELTRAAVMNQAWNLENVELDLLLPGVTVSTDGAEDPFAIETMYLATYNGAFWDLPEEPVNLEGQTRDFLPE